VARLIVMSNRLAIPGEISSAGGLAVGVLAALRADEGGVWFGWSGKTQEARALEQAIVMPLAERRSRQEENLKALRANSIARWYESFIARLAA
jgi:trehalose-6-phosphate synthase